MTEINHNKRIRLVISCQCARGDSSDKEAIAYVGDNHNLRCKHCWYEWTESWRPSMTKQDKPSPK